MKKCSSFSLKIIATVFMTLDHIGYFLYPGVEWYRIVGRLALPIYAFLCAESYRYTHNRNLYLGRLLVMGGLMEVVVQWVAPGSSANIFLTLAFGFGMLWGLDGKQPLLFAASLICGVLLSVDYGWYGMTMIVVMYYFKDKMIFYVPIHWIMTALYVQTSWCAPTQYYSIFALSFLLMYNGQVGCKKGKYFFYVYYPLHVAVLALWSMIKGV